jgi:hypothetical protein
MKLHDFLEENNLKLNKRGIDCFSKAIKNIFPNISYHYREYEFIMYFDFREQDLLEVIKYVHKYNKMYVFL